MLGGMWGFYNTRDRSLADQLYGQITNKEINRELAQLPNNRDQTFLKKYVHKFLRDRSVIHDSYCCAQFNDSVPFPTQRQGNCYIGSTARNLACLKEVSHLLCPIDCRPELHKKDWLFC